MIKDSDGKVTDSIKNNTEVEKMIINMEELVYDGFHNEKLFSFNKIVHLL